MMRKYKDTIFFIILCILFLEVVFSFPISIDGFMEAQGSKETQSFPNNLAEQKMLGVHLIESQLGRKDWEFFAESAEGYEGKGLWELQKVKVYFYGNNLLNFVVTGQKGIIDTKTKDMNISGQVVTTSSNGYKFQTPTINYVAKERKLISNEFVKVTGPKGEFGRSMLLTGQSMETFVDQNNMIVKGNVRGERQVSLDKDVVIKSGGVNLSGRNNEVHFFESVVITLDSATLEGPEAYLNFQPKTDLFQSLIIKGGVKLNDIDKQATADVIKYENSQNKMILTGKPKVLQNDDEIFGDRIIFYDGGRKIRVENIRAHVESPVDNSDQEEN